MTPELRSRIDARAIRDRDGEAVCREQDIQSVITDRGSYSVEMERHGLRRSGKTIRDVIPDPTRLFGDYIMDEDRLCDCPYWEHERRNP